MSSPNKRFAQVRFAFAELCEHPDFQGRWVALDKVSYDSLTSKPVEGDVVDADADLAALCSRMRAHAQRACAVVHCIEQVASMSRGGLLARRGATSRPGAGAPSRP